MKKKQVNEIFYNQMLRRNNIIKFILFILLVFVITIFSLIKFISENKNLNVNYKEANNVDYKVFLKENNFYESSYLTNNNEYISSIVESIKASFNHTISMEKEIDFIYSYKIDLVLDIINDKDSRTLFSKTYNILENNDINVYNSKQAIISEDIDIDYNKYNSLSNTFIGLYGLNDVSSSLTAKMTINIRGNCDYENSTLNDSEVSMIIPLSKKTFGIELKNNILEGQENIMICEPASINGISYLIAFVISLIIIIVYIILLIKYIIKTRTPQSIYDIELKKILNYYHSYIQKIDNNIELMVNNIKIDKKNLSKDYNFFKLTTFTDMLEIRDNLNSPILMSTNKDNTATYFIVFDLPNMAVYMYGIRVDDIVTKIEEDKNEQENSKKKNSK